MMDDVVFKIFNVERTAETALKYGTAMNLMSFSPLVYLSTFSRKKDNQAAATELFVAEDVFRKLLMNHSTMKETDDGKLKLEIEYTKGTSNFGQVLPDDDFKVFVDFMSRVLSPLFYDFANSDLSMVPVGCDLIPLNCHSGEGLRQCIIGLKLDGLTNPSEDTWRVCADCYVFDKDQGRYVPWKKGIV